MSTSDYQRELEEAANILVEKELAAWIKRADEGDPKALKLMRDFAAKNDIAKAWLLVVPMAMRQLLNGQLLALQDELQMAERGEPGISIYRHTEAENREHYSLDDPDNWRYDGYSVYHKTTGSFLSRVGLWPSG